MPSILAKQELNSIHGSGGSHCGRVNNAMVASDGTYCLPGSLIDGTTRHGCLESRNNVPLNTARGGRRYGVLLLSDTRNVLNRCMRAIDSLGKAGPTDVLLNGSNIRTRSRARHAIRTTQCNMRYVCIRKRRACNAVSRGYRRLQAAEGDSWQQQPERCMRNT